MVAKELFDFFEDVEMSHLTALVEDSHRVGVPVMYASDDGKDKRG